MKQIGGGGPTTIFEDIESGDIDNIRWRVEKFSRQPNEFNRKNNQGETPLHVAIPTENIEMCELLIEGGADVNIRDNKGQTALHIASEEGHSEVVKLLINAGADVNIKDKNGPPIMTNKK